MVLMLAIPIRKIYGLEDFITERHLQNAAKVMLATGLIVAYGYGIEAFMAGIAATATMPSRCGTACTALRRPLLSAAHLQHLHPQVLWIRKLRTSPIALFFVSGVILVACAGALHHRGGEPAPRLPHLVVGMYYPRAGIG